MKKLVLGLTAALCVASSSFAAADERCDIACYSTHADQSLYSVGGGIYVMGFVTVPGVSIGGICLPKGNESDDISALTKFKILCQNALPYACYNQSCWAGGNTGH